MYKVGEKVETPQFTGTIEKVYESGVKVNGKMFPLKDIKPYRTAHEKLLAMGYEYSYKECGDELSDKWHTFYNKKRFITIDVIVNNISGIGWYITFHDPFNCIANIELSRILTQYLEELEAKE